jgi:hypothetical protein
MRRDVTTLRASFICDQCGRYLGSIGESGYLPPPYPVAVASVQLDDEALFAFEWHMVELMRNGKFTFRHPQIDGRCVSIREWYRDRYGDEADDDQAASD